MEVSLRPRKEINYKVMHHGEPMEEALSTSLCTRTIVLKEVFYVERIIWRRRIPGQTVSLQTKTLLSFLVLSFYIGS